MKKEKGDSKLFWAEIFIIIGAIFLSINLIDILNKYIIKGYVLILGLVLIIIGAALKSVKK